jgi:hypothetical protein
MEYSYIAFFLQKEWYNDGYNKEADMRIWIDGDACPVKNIIIDLAKKAELPVTIVKNHSHRIEIPGVEVVTVDGSSDSADYYITNHIQPQDLVITQDYGLAAMVLARKGEAMTIMGAILNEFNIDMHLSRRHVNRENRMKHQKYTKFKKRTVKDDTIFQEAFAQFLRERGYKHD